MVFHEQLIDKNNNCELSIVPNNPVIIDSYSNIFFIDLHIEHV